MLSNQTLSALSTGCCAQASNAEEEKSSVFKTASCKRDENEAAGRVRGSQHMAR